MKLNIEVDEKHKDFYEVDEDASEQGKEAIKKRKQKEFAAYVVPHKLFADALYKVRECLESSEVADSNACLITGLPGTGKSTLCKNLKSNIEKQVPPQTIVGDDSIKKIIPVFYIKLDGDVTTKRLAKGMLLALGEMNVSGDGTDLTMRLVQLLKTCETKLILMDEFHHLLLRGAEKTKEAVCNWVKYLLDSSQVPIVILGTPDCEAIINGNSQLSRRACFRARLKTFEYSSDEKSEYIKVIRALNKAFEGIGGVQNSPMLTDERMALALYIATGGLMDSIRKLLDYGLRHAHQENKETVGFTDFEKAYTILTLEGALLEQTDNKKRDPNPFAMSTVELTGILSKARNPLRKKTL